MRYLKTEEEVLAFEEEFNYRIVEEINKENPGGLLEYLLDGNMLNAIPQRSVVDRLFKDLLTKEQIDEIYNHYKDQIGKY